jgi:outer membrane protein assembly factor BamB
MSTPAPKSRWRTILPPVLFGVLVLAIVGFLFGEQLLERWRQWRLDSTPLPEPEHKMQVTLSAALTTDWPQWNGPGRDGISHEKDLLRTFPKDGPKLLWTAETLGAGYSAPAVVGGKLFVPGTRGDTEYVFVLDAKTGKPEGEAVLGHLYRNDYGSGPRGTPAIDGDRLYALSGDGTLSCLGLTDGNVRWRKRIYKEFGGQCPNWGCGESPLVDGDRVLCTPGGAQGTVLALHKMTGDKLWQSAGFTDAAGYSSLVVAEFGGVRQYVQMTFHHVAGIAAQDGRLLWKVAREGPNAPIPTPIIHGDHVFATSGYGAGCHLIKVSRQGDGFTAELVKAAKTMSNHHGGVVRLGEHLYGYADNKGWVCLDFHTLEQRWQEKRKLTKGSILAADGKLFCYGEEDGTLVVLEVSPKEWKEKGRFKIPRQTATDRRNGGIWTHPVIADGKLFLRDQELLFCYELR